MNAPIIQLDSISRVFTVGAERIHGLREVTLTIGHGEYVAIMGPSGSGKSTLLNTIGLLDRPDSGRYFLSGRDVAKEPDDERARLRLDKIGFIFQFFHLIPRLNAAENVALPLTLSGVSVRERRTRVDELLAAFGLADRAGHRQDQLSGGQRQRVAIARAMVTNPDILLADEPTGNLDRASGLDVMNILERLNREGKTLLMVTHDQELGCRARRQIRMVDGAVVEDLGPCA